MEEVDIPDIPKQHELHCLDGIQLSSSLAYVPEKIDDLIRVSATVVSYHHQLRHNLVCSWFDPDVVYSSGSADQGWHRRVNRVNLKTGKFAKLGEHNCLCLDARFGLVAILEYRKLILYDENQLVAPEPDTAHAIASPNNDAEPVLAPKKVYEDTELSSGQPNHVSIRRCQGRLIVIIPHNGGAVDIYELLGDYDLDSPDFAIPSEPVFSRTRALDASANINCTSLDPTEKILICGIDGGNGPLFVEIDHLADGTWKCEPLIDEDEVATDQLVAERARLALFKFDERAPNISNIAPEELKNDPSVPFVVNPRAVTLEPNPNPPTNRLPFDSDEDSDDEERNTLQYRLRMDSLHCSWCPWSPRYCASATDQSMCFLWDWVEKKKIAAWCSIGQVSTGYSWNNARAIALVLFSPVPSVPRA